MMIDYEHQTFDEMMDAIDADIKRIKAEIARADAAFEGAE